MIYDENNDTILTNNRIKLWQITSYKEKLRRHGSMNYSYKWNLLAKIYPFSRLMKKTGLINKITPVEIQSSY